MRTFFLCFVFFNCVFYRDFSYLGVHFGEVPIYVTELVLIIVFLTWGISGCFRGKLAIKKRDLYVVLPLLSYFVWGLFGFRGVSLSDILLSIRQFASVYYSLFFLIVILLIRSEKDYYQLMRTILVASALSMIVIILRVFLKVAGHTTTIGAYRYGNYEIIGLLILFAVLMSKTLDLKKKGAFQRIFFILAISFCVVFLIQHRSATLALAVTAILIFRLHPKIKRRVLLVPLMVILISLVMAFASFTTDLGPATLSRLITLSPEKDPNIGWRVAVWLQALNDMRPVEYFIGVGWGNSIPNLYFSGRVYGIKDHIGMHNSILFYFYHLGLIGIVSFMWVLSRIYVTAYRIVSNIKNPFSGHVLALLSANVGMLVFAQFNVVLEGPYMASVFWVSLGLLWVGGQLAIKNYQHSVAI